MPARSLALLALLAAALLLAACGGDSGDAPKRVTIDSARKSAKRAKATATGIVERPGAVAIRVSAAPKQRVDVSWALSCPKTDDGKDRKPAGGTYVTTPPDVRTLRLPKRTIAFCAVNAQAQLRRSGRVKIAVLGTPRPKS